MMSAHLFFVIASVAKQSRAAGTGQIALVLPPIFRGGRNDGIRTDSKLNIMLRDPAAVARL